MTFFMEGRKMAQSVCPGCTSTNIKLAIATAQCRDCGHKDRKYAFIKHLP